MLTEVGCADDPKPYNGPFDVTNLSAMCRIQTSMGANPSWSFRPRGQRVVAANWLVHLGTHSPHVSEGKRFAGSQAYSLIVSSLSIIDLG